MAESTSASLVHVWNKLQEKLSSAASSSSQFLTPELKKLNNMVYEVHSPLPEEKPQLEVLFCHGLQLKHGKDTYWRTWTTRDGSHLWLKTWLVELFPKARILMMSYDASIKKTDKSGRMDIYCTTENLVHDLTGDEVSIGQAGCPIVLVGHCLGGLLLKELCITAARMLGPNRAEAFGSARIRNLFDNLKGMFFYGTPHNGSLLGDGLQSDFEEGELVDDIKILNASSARRNEQFAKFKSECRWFTYGLSETQETYVDCLGKRIHVVPEASARSGMDRHYSVDADHHDICRPDGMTASSVTCLRNFLHQIQKAGECQAGAMVDFKSSRGYVDLEGRAKQVRSMLAGQEAVFITGLSGIGKTALAQQIVQDIGHNFQVTSFVSLDSIQEPVNSCKQQVLRKIVEGLDARNIHGNIISHDILSNVLYYLKERKVLIVLDNVESQEQLEALRTDIWLQGTASKLIVTTTYLRLCTPSKTFKVTYLSEIESQLLFRYYAFEGGDGPHDLRDLIAEVIEQCEHFPLALKILGSYVSTGDVRRRQLWLDLSERLEEAQDVDCGRDDRLWAKLMVCYDVLLPTEKEIFLDVAAVFHGVLFSFVECIWQGSRKSSYVAWSNLERRFLASVDEDGNIWMHSYLRNLGKSIACPREKSVAEWKRMRSSSSAKELISKHQGIVHTLSLELQISQGESLSLKKSTFLNYVYLRYLSLEGVEATSSRVDLPSSIVYLRWTNGLFKVCPVDFTCLENLVALQLRDCRSMESLSPSIVCATKLQWLELDGCLSLTMLPTGMSRCLHHLTLENTAISELPRDLGNLKRLTHLKVGSPHLTRVPPGLGRLQMLSSLSLSGKRVTALPESIGNLTGLKYLDLQNTSLISIPDSIGRLKQLRELNLKDSRMVSSLPDSIGSLTGLTNLNLERTILGSLPESIGQLQSLTKMSLDGTCLKGLPESIGDLANLRQLHLDNTPLETLPDSICNLHSLSTLRLMRTEIGTVPDGIGALGELYEIHISSSYLKAWPKTFGQLFHLRYVSIDVGPLANGHVSGLYSREAGGQDQDMALDIRSLLSQLPSLRGLYSLRLQGRGFPQAWMQPLFRALQQMPSLAVLKLVEFNLVKTIPDELGTLARLDLLNVTGWERLVEFPESLGELRMLHHLRLRDNPRLDRLPESFSALSLSYLWITGCGSLQSMPRCFGRVPSREGESPTSRVSTHTAFERVQKSATTSAPPELLPLKRGYVVDSDSWELVKSFLECPWKHFAHVIWYHIACKEMEKVRKKAIWREGVGFVVDTAVAMDLLEGRDLNVSGRHDGLQDISRPSYHSLSHNCAPDRSFRFRCTEYFSRDRCAFGHSIVYAMDVSEESAENSEGQGSATDDEESQEGDSQG